MGVLNFIVDMSQEGRLDEHDDEIKELKEIVYNLHLWIVYLDEELKKVKAQNGTSSSTSNQSV